MKTRTIILSLTLAGLITVSSPADACTGITLTAKDSTTIVARTIEWGGSDLNSQYIIVPRGYTSCSYTPEGVQGMSFTSRYGYVGLAVEQKDFIAEGINEAGLSAGLFYFRITGNMKPMMRKKRHQYSRFAIGGVDIGQLCHDKRSDRKREAGAYHQH